MGDLIVIWLVYSIFIIYDNEVNIQGVRFSIEVEKKIRFLIFCIRKQLTKKYTYNLVS